ncbi:hypothetical protein L2E82_16682 [Cichorium intybus]|uniref:Uncharacterized protein n=1 Tax=Cichorium intybus TaxID=13427 RepID=A0ACB9F7J5_CICIN|nr:hypothetical protein L2E82_16682 [Cichorium intybus]
MNRQPPNSEEWTEVRRRRLKPVITTYFASGIPDRITTGDVAKVFAPFGKLSDVYVARKRDTGGKLFAFIKFEGVGDEKELERRLQGVKIQGITLTINIARYQRKEINPKIPTHHHHGSFIRPNTGEEPAEEGEFRPDDNNPANLSTGGTEMAESPVSMGNRKHNSTTGGNQSLINEVEESPGESRDTGNQKGTEPGGEHVQKENSDKNNSEKNGSNDGPGNKLISLGCFGPFPSKMIFGMTESAISPNQGIERPNNKRAKRRRADSAGRSCSPRDRLNEERTKQTQDNHIDLNVNPQKSISSTSELSNNSTEEISNTIKIGAEVGFQIEERDAVVLAEAIGDNGGKKTAS